MAAADQPSEGRDCRLGVLAFGDSITNGGGELQWGVALQSWALWTARALGLPYTGYAVDGAGVADVIAEQLTAFGRRQARPDARFDVGCLYVGVNDVRAPGWDPETFRAGYASALRFLADRCDRVLTLTAPVALGVPSTGARVRELNAIVGRAAGAAGALVVDLSAFGARNHVMADRVHPTAFGQIAIAERALGVLARDGLPARIAPSQLISFSPTRWRRLQGDWVYAYRSAKLWAGAAGLRLAGATCGPDPVSEGVHVVSKQP